MGVQTLTLGGRRGGFLTLVPLEQHDQPALAEAVFRVPVAAAQQVEAAQVALQTDLTAARLAEDEAEAADAVARVALPEFVPEFVQLLTATERNSSAATKKPIDAMCTCMCPRQMSRHRHVGRGASIASEEAGQQEFLQKAQLEMLDGQHVDRGWLSIERTNFGNLGSAVSGDLSGWGAGQEPMHFNGDTLRAPAGQTGRKEAHMQWQISGAWLRHAAAVGAILAVCGAPVATAAAPACPSYQLSTANGGCRTPGAVNLQSFTTLWFEQKTTTTHRRSGPVDSLRCRGTYCEKYAPSVVVCENSGVDSNGEVRWACTADGLDYRLKLAGEDVHCEGYDHRADTAVLEGSCGLEHTLEPSGARHARPDPTWSRASGATAGGGVAPGLLAATAAGMYFMNG